MASSGNRNVDQQPRLSLLSRCRRGETAEMEVAIHKANTMNGQSFAIALFGKSTQMSPVLRNSEEGRADVKETIAALGFLSRKVN